MRLKSVLMFVSAVLLAFNVAGEGQSNMTQKAAHYPQRHHPHPGVLILIIQGSAVTVAEKEETSIVVPQTGDQEHLLLNSPYPSREDDQVSGSCSEGAYLFTLTGAETKAGNRKEFKGTLIDPTFSPIIFKIDWKLRGEEKEYFVLMRLPAPRTIRALGPLYEVSFAGLSKPSLVPLTELLEFPVRDLNDVRLVRRCGKEKKIERPLSCQEMLRKYKGYFQKYPMADSPDSQRPYINYELQNCSENTSYLFVGIGLGPTLSHGQLEAHGRYFFNHKILLEIYGGEQNVPPGRRIVEKGYGLGNDDGGRKLKLIRASFGEQKPLYTPVAMTENCTAPGGIVLR